MSRLTPLGAVVAGALAGLTGAIAQDVFFRLTRRWAPKDSNQRFTPPDAQRPDESETQTVARRTVTQLAQRGPLGNAARAAHWVHYGYGTAWGTGYGIVAGSLHQPRSPISGATFGLVVWGLSEGLVLPLFRVAAWPLSYPLKTHAYSLAAHLAYGVTVWGAYRVFERAERPLLMAVAGAWLTRRIPRFARPTARRMTTRGVNLAFTARNALEAVSGA